MIAPSLTRNSGSTSLSASRDAKAVVSSDRLYRLSSNASVPGPNTRETGGVRRRGQRVAEQLSSRQTCKERAGSRTAACARGSTRWGRRTGRFRRAHPRRRGLTAGSPLRPTRSHRRAPYGRSAASGWATVKKAGGASSSSSSRVLVRAMTGWPLWTAATGSEKGYAALAQGRGGTGKEDVRGR